MLDLRAYEQRLADYETADRFERWFLRTLAMDATHLPNVHSAKTQWWSGAKAVAATTSSSWLSWQKPKNASFVAMCCLGGASGGAGAGLSGVGTAKGGGGGGGTGAMARAIYLAETIPQQLFILPGCGSKGGSAYVLASTPAYSCISGAPQSIDKANLLLFASGAAAPPLVTGAGNCLGGAGGAVTPADFAAYTGFALSYLSTAGQTGAAGGAPDTAGSSLTFGQVGLPVSGGAGGGSATSVDRAGGAIIGAGPVLTIPGGTTGVGVLKNGNPGYALRAPWIGVGGSGAGSSDGNQYGGVGGIGGPGSGGGGGGAGANGSATSSLGGDGGPGLVMIAWW